MAASASSKTLPQLQPSASNTSLGGTKSRSSGFTPHIPTQDEAEKCAARIKEAAALLQQGRDLQRIYPARALELFVRAAELENPDAMAEISLCHQHQRGLTAEQKDPKVAAAMAERGHGMGSQLATAALANCLVWGWGTSENKKRGNE